MVGQTLERAFDPLTSALKRAALKRADKQAQQFAAADAPRRAPAKAAMPVSPLAVPFPKMPPIAGVQMATARAGFYKHERDDLLVMSFPEGASCAGVFTRHGVGSAPGRLVQAASGDDQGRGRPRPGGQRRLRQLLHRPARARTPCAGSASAAGKRFDCRQRDVMVASTGVIGVLLDDAKIVHQPARHRAAADRGRLGQRGRAPS